MGDLLGLVLGGGGARGAYEIGVAQFLFEDLMPKLGLSPGVDILCGTSAGAINACGIASFADEPLRGVAALAHRWTDLVLDRVVKTDRLEALAVVRSLLGCGPPRLLGARLRGGLIDPTPLREAFAPALDFGRIQDQIQARRLRALSLSATEVATGRTTLFVQRPAGLRGAAWPQRPSTVVSDVIHTADHVLASAAIPLVLPPVRIHGRLYCDGSLRQHVPLSPALHLGASRLLVVTTQPAAPSLSPLLGEERESAYPSPLYMLGKTLTALTLDRVDDDIDRLQQINGLIAAGERAFGPSFLPRLNQALGRKQALRWVECVVIRPSEDLGRMAAELVRSPDFKRRIGDPMSRLLARVAEGEAEHDADLLSHLLFDGRYARELIALGRADARSREEELCALVGRPPPRTRARAS